MHRGPVILVLALWAGLACGAEPTLAQKQARAQQERAELRAQIESLQKEIDSRESSRRDAAHDLKASESAISSASRRLAELASEQKRAEQELERIDAQTAKQKQVLARRQAELGDQLRAQYAGGLSPWTALLSGDSPQIVGRDLRYLGYITQEQAEAVKALRGAIDALAALQARTEAGRKELAQLAREAAEQKTELEKQKEQRREVLDRIEAELKEQHGQAERLARNDQRLGGLISGLEKAIARQAEEARIAEEKRRAEAARKAEQARLALERERAQARKAEQAARQAQEQAQRQRDQLEAEKARIQVEQARARARAAEEAAARPPAPPEAGREAEVRGTVEGKTGAPRLAPAGGFKGLAKGAPWPVQGQVQGKFGAERPEGGLWRGIVLRSPEGAAVRAIGPGRVVYANWLSGFGNIMIIDHGAKYLSVYAYNQSLQKRVGDIVDAGDTIATVGATGGQVEPGLYFEIRHQGTPVNPLLWLRR
ncbi:MAG TPA: peptidoglycan DD-metalloendopeptidase family protein [Burkholderiaceae bacterium]|nr:peptidoglycan DD-metalloendopeptidase family protein [Burkholderiaceae bacterium]